MQILKKYRLDPIWSTRVAFLALRNNSSMGIPYKACPTVCAGYEQPSCEAEKLAKLQILS